MQSGTKAIIFVLIAAFISAAAQIVLKLASNELSFTLIGLLTNIPLIAGFFLYGIASVLFILALKQGELTVLYPILATTYVWIAIGSPLFFKEDFITPLKIIGNAVVIMGVFLIAKGMCPSPEVA